MGASLGLIAGKVAGAASVAAPILSSAGGVFSALGEGSQKKAWGKYQAKQAAADGQAALGVAKVEAQKIRRAAKEQQSKAIAATAASGVDVGDGSAALIQNEITQRAESDALMAIFDGQDALYRNLAQGQAYKIQGEAASKSSMWKAGGSLLGLIGGGAGLISKWAKGSQMKSDFGAGLKMGASAGKGK